MKDVKEQAAAAKKASFYLASMPGSQKNRVLQEIAALLLKRQHEIFAANQLDMTLAAQGKLAPSLLKRLKFDETKLNELLRGIKDLIRLAEPVGKCLNRTQLDKGLILSRITVPIGLIGVIFESRPDALVQITCLCLKSGNAVILKGGREARETNQVLYELIIKAACSVDPLFGQAVQLVTTREEISALLALDELVDLMIPRGSGDLVRYIKENTRIPVLGHADGVCHVYIDKKADQDMALRITKDAKTQYPAVCNAVETLLVHEEQAAAFLPRMARVLDGVELRGCERTAQIIEVQPASQGDWRAEYNDMILAVKVVGSLAEAIEHINTYGSHHTDAIVTADKDRAARFQAGVDSSSVMWNCSTRFADGFRYGLGAEVGISTNKIHARGPVGLDGLLIYKYILEGNGQIVADYSGGQKSFARKKLS